MKILQRLLVIVAILASQLSLAQEARIRNDIQKSQFIFNFIDFIAWPKDQQFSEAGPISLCVFQRASILDELDLVKQRYAELGLEVQVRDIDTIEQARGCRIAYLGKHSPIIPPELAYRAYPILVVGEDKHFLARGGMIALEERGVKVKVAVNLPRLEAVGFKVSAKLLKVARVEKSQLAVDSFLQRFLNTRAEQVN